MRAYRPLEHVTIQPAGLGRPAGQPRVAILIVGDTHIAVTAEELRAVADDALRAAKDLDVQS